MILISFKYRPRSTFLINCSKFQSILLKYDFIVLPNGKVIYLTKGTPQGDILSPLLANINLNEFDWWIGGQWEERDCKELVPQYNSKGTRHKSHVYRKLRASTTLKEM